MVRRTITYIILIFIISCCTGARNEFGKRRFVNKPLGSIKPNSDINAYKIIDTTKLYRMITNNENREIGNKLRESHIKFYREGRLGDFNSFNINNLESLNPKKSEPNYFNYKNGELIIQCYFQHPQGGGLIKGKLTKKIGDTLEFEFEGKIRKYISINLPKKFLIYNPDW